MDAKELYSFVLLNANKFLRVVGTFEFAEISRPDFNPSLQDIAETMKAVSVQLKRLNNDVLVEMQCDTYVGYMEQMARAIGRGDEDELYRLAGELRKMSFVYPNY